MPHWNRVTIVGVGLIGGSIGLAMRKRGLADQVVGCGRRLESLEAAQSRGALDAASLSLEEAAADADLVIACAPVHRIPQHLQAAAAVCREGALLTDVGSTKVEIVRSLENLPQRARFVAAHPLAGSEKSGPENADAALFEDCTVVATPTASTPASAIEEVTQLWNSMGARVVTRSPESHDRALAATSHLPHVVAAALAAMTDPKDLPLAATGWSDTTRIAAGDVELWRQILHDNRENVAQAIRELESALARFRTALDENDQETITELLKQGKKHRDLMGS